MHDAPLICTIVLTWNNRVDTDECLSALSAATYSNQRIILVDNGSVDGSAEALLATWGGQVDFVRSDWNRGCGGGYNLGIERALELGADYLAIVDNDVVTEPGLFEALLEPFAAPGVALTSPLVLRYDDPGRVWFFTAVYNPLLGFMRHKRTGARLSDLASIIGRRFRTAYAPTCSVLISREALHRVGLMDERLFYGHDDVDWCFRAADAGLECVVVARPLARHKIAGTGGKRGSSVLNAFAAYHFARGAFLIGRKHARGPRALSFLVGQVVLRLPFHAARMLAARDWSGLLGYGRGIFDGLRLYWLPGRRAEKTVSPVAVPVTPAPYAQPREP